MAKTPKRPRDPNQLAKLVVDIATGGETDHPRVTLSEVRKRASAKGGTARAEKLSSQERSDIAANAANRRWKGQG